VLEHDSKENSMNMQQQTQTNTLPRHVKVAYNGEYRRFALPSLQFAQLEDTLRTLYNLGSSQFKVKFQDDENDWVVLSTDEELKYAIELTGNPIRLTIADVRPVEQKPLASPEVAAFPEETTFATPYRGGFGKGKGRGCGRGKGKFNNPVMLERLQMKQELIGSKIASLEEMLKTPELSSERERVLLWKLEKLNKKQLFVEKRRLAFESGVNETSDVPDGEENVATDGWKRRGCGGRGRYGKGPGPHGHHHGPHHGPDDLDHPFGPGPHEFGHPGPHGPHHGPRFGPGPHGGRKGRKFDFPPMDEGAAREAFKSFAKAKADLETARASGDMQAIVTCELALKQAKHQMKQGKWTILSPYKAQKRECMINLKRAKQSGDEAQIKACESALVQAIVAIRKAKAQLVA